MRYQYLLFDFDDTLLDFKKTERDAFQNAMIRCGLETKDGYLELYSEINHRKWMLMNEGLIQKDEIFRSRFGEFFEQVGIQYDSELFNQIYIEELSIPIYYIKGVTEVLSKLSKQHELYIVTNGIYSVQQPRFDRCDFKRYIKDVFISEHIGYEKPQKEFFDAVFRTLPSARKEEFLIIGDSLTSDIRGGNVVDIHTCWFNPENKPHNGIDAVDYEIRELKELFDIVEL